MTGKNCAACQAEMDPDAIFCNECGLAQPTAVGFGSTSDYYRSEPSPTPAASKNTFGTPSADTKICPNCGRQARASAGFCSGCAFDFSRRSPGSMSSPPQDSATGFPPELVLAVTRRYKDGYMYARFFNGVGKFIKGLGFVIGIVIALAGLIIGVGIEEQSRNSFFGGPGAGVGIGVGFVFVVSAAIITAIFWVVGVIVKAGAQMLKASLDGAVHSSPFLTDLDRATIMSLPTGRMEKKL